MKEQHEYFKEVMEHIIDTCHNQWDNKGKSYDCGNCPYFNLCDFFDTCPNAMRIEHLIDISHLTET